MDNSLRLLPKDDSAPTNCGSGGGDDSNLSLRVASIFVILVGSSIGALFPVLTRRTKWLGSRVPKRAFDTAKYFGSGVIVRSILCELYGFSSQFTIDCNRIYPSSRPCYRRTRVIMSISCMAGICTLEARFIFVCFSHYIATALRPSHCAHQHLQHLHSRACCLSLGHD